MNYGEISKSEKNLDQAEGFVVKAADLDIDSVMGKKKEIEREGKCRV